MGFPAWLNAMLTANVNLLYSLGSNRIAIGAKHFAKLSEALNVKPGRHAGLTGRRHATRA